jgi:hypothetical protein
MASKINKNRNKTAATQGAARRIRLPKNNSLGGVISIGTFNMPQSHKKGKANVL